MPEFRGVPISVFFLVPPLVAFVAVLAYMTAPRLRRDVSLRGVLIVSVALAAAEALALVFVVGLFVLFGASGGMRTF